MVMRISILILLSAFYAVSTSAQTPMYKLISGNAQGCVLRSFYGGTLVYSVRKVVANYTGSCLRVRRSSDNTEQDIGFGLDGILDTSALKTFVTTNSGYVTKFYCQSPLGTNATQTTNANQPRIVNAGVVERKNGIVSLRFIAASPSYLQASGFAGVSTAFSVSVVTSTNTISVNSFFSDDGGGFNNSGMEGSFGTFRFNKSGSGVTVSSPASLSANVMYCISLSYTSANIATVVVNTTSGSPTSVGTFTNGSLGNNIGRYNAIASYSLDGYISEYIVFNNSNVDLASLRANQIAFYGL